MALSNVRWEGIKAIEKMSDILPSKIAGQKLRSAYRKSLTPVRDSMRDKIPVGRTGNLWYATDLNINGRTTEDMYGLVGPRRRKNVWNMQGWHAHIIEKGTKAHKIPKGIFTSFFGAKKMPIWTKQGFTGEFTRQLKHGGSKAYKPFQRSIDANWKNVSDIVSDEVAKIMREEIKNIKQQYGKVATL